MSKKDIYFLADLHITYDPPKCRLETPEEWMEVQRDRIEQVAKIVKNDLLVICGDIIDVWKPKNSQEIMNMLADTLPKNTVWIMGNHEVRGANQDRERALKEGTFGTMTRMKGMEYITEPFEWGNYVLYPNDFAHKFTLKHMETDPSKTNIALGHFLSFPKELPHWADKEEDHIAKDIIKEFPEYDLFVIGDYHVPFLVDDKYLSPGSLTRRTTNQIDYKPAIWKYNNEGWESIPFKIKPPEECMSKEHIIKKQERDGRLDDWGNKLNEQSKEDITGDFKADLPEYFTKNKTKSAVQNMMYGYILEVEGE